MRGVNAEPRPAAPSPHPVQAAPAPGGPARRLWIPAAALAAVGGAFAYVAAVDPNEPGHYPVCPLWRFTGLYCPGCGGLRSAHAFAHGDLATAFQDNALAVAAFLALAALWTVWVVRTVRGRPMRLELPSAARWALGASVLVFTVVRNLPFGAWLHP
ncbi:DUF2752 domain-containing protein [Streptomyces heilongjiangensis]|uniref:DUF2752 domain-containing protein n=1 Tax=Streptomyces heilongjiangensis TaxID=945052 RepID=A0ABW1B1G0_9ACTN|nr:DUF2752 domain-containing protein [Streptomyces heilongjiangensis]MDC2949907.1 DUF2752 domain-containing protein [Streptomyces heilongjiangensis]